MSAFPKYPAYKDSGVKWLGEVPGHWQTVRAKHVFSNVTEKGYPEEPLLSATQDQGVVPRDSREQRVVMPLGQLETFKLVRKHDFVISLRSFQGGIEHSNYRGLVSPAYTVLRQKRELNPGYLRHLLKASSFISELNVSVTGIRQGKNIDFNVFAESFLPIPPRAEQDRIVAFLDEKTAQINALIAKKQRQIELLGEQKAILINRAVTRGVSSDLSPVALAKGEASAKAGLHPHESTVASAKAEPDLQDSGIPWIGPIPKHWKVMKLKYLISIQAGYAFASSAYSHNPQDTRLLRGVNVNPGKITWNDVVYWPEKKMRGVEDFALAEDDMVMGMDRPWVSSGVRVARITKADLPCLLLQRVARIRATKIEPDFLERVLTGAGFKAYFEPILTGVSVPHISPDQIGGYTAAIPPESEQKTICAFINQAEALCTKVKAAEESQIQTLQTLRSTLIAHAVTGKIQVS